VAASLQRWLGLHQTDGGAYDFFTLQADMMCNFILDQAKRPERAAKFHDLKVSDRPDLSGGIEYVDSARHATYVKKSVFKKYSDKLMRRFKWKAFGTMLPPGDVREAQRSARLRSRPNTARRTSSSAT
jgi:hypothetical protein